MVSTPSATTEEMWAIPVDIQSKVGQTLAKNVILRKEVEELKNA